MAPVQQNEIHIFLVSQRLVSQNGKQQLLSSFNHTVRTINNIVLSIIDHYIISLVLNHRERYSNVKEQVSRFLKR